MPVAKISYPVLRIGEVSLPGHIDIKVYGPWIPVSISALNQLDKNKEPVTVEGAALIDTGATYTCIDDCVCSQLDLQLSSGKIEMNGIGGQAECLCYPVQVQFAIKDFNIPPLPVYRAPNVKLHSISTVSGSLIALIGRDLLAHFKFTYDGRRGSIEIAY